MTDHHYFDDDGNPISLLEWGHRFEQDRTRWETDIGGGRVIRTVWLGFVDPLSDAHLFGTAFYSGGFFAAELAQYDTKQQAEQGHARHVEEQR